MRKLHEHPSKNRNRRPGEWVLAGFSPSRKSGVGVGESVWEVGLNPKGCWYREREPREIINIIISRCFLSLRGVFNFSTFKTSILRIISRFYLQYFSQPEESKAMHFSCRMLSYSAFAMSGCQGDFIITKVLPEKGLRAQPPTDTRQRGRGAMK